MMTPLRPILLASLCLAQTLPLAAQDKSKGKDVTPLEIQEKLYKWSKAEREDKSLKARLAPAASQWMNRSTAPINGFVVLPSGDRFVGTLEIHNRLTKEAEDGKSTDPNADLIELSITQDGKTDKFALAAVSVFGAHFTVSDWQPVRKSKELADAYQPGFIQLDNDVRSEGLVALSSRKESGGTLRPFDRVYFAANATTPVEVYLTPGTSKPGMPNVTDAGQKGGTEASYQLLGGSLIDKGAWIAQLERDPKKLQAGPLVPGEVVFASGAVLKGRLSLLKSATHVYLIDEEQDVLSIGAGAGIKVMNATANGVAQQYVVLKGEFVNSQDAVARFKKNESLHPGKVVLASGQELVGSVSIERVRNMVKSYQIPLAVYFQPKTEPALLSYHLPDAVEYFEEEVDGATTRYVPLENTFVAQDKYLAGLESNKSKTKTRNLHAGYVVLEDGTRQKGRIAQQSSGFVLVDDASRFKKYRPTEKGLSYFVQTIDGAERRFIPLMAGVRAFSDAGMEFVEMLEADKAFSYYRNPNPTHLRKLANAVAKGAINTATDVGRVAVANAAAKEAVKSSVQASPGDIAGAVVAGAQAQQDALALTQGVVEVGSEGGLYHKEWVVVNNATKERTVVYSGNDSKELTRLLSACPKFGALVSRDAKRLTGVGNLADAVTFLNSCR